MDSNRRRIEKEIRSSARKAVVTASAVSLIIGSLTGATFGFLSADVGKKELPKIVQQLKGIQNQSNTASGNNQSSAAVSSQQEDAAVISVVEKDAPAVVSIVITKDVPTADSYFSNPFFDDPFFNPFGYQQRRQQPSAPQTEKREIGGGTGFIISSDGYIVTNKHVVEDQQADYTVVTNDGKKLSATVLARDPLNDLAIIKVNEKNLPVVDLGSSDSLKIGQTVIAIGNSLGEFRNTVSKGIVSGLKRNLNAGDGLGQSELLEEVIQTDAAINPGNSGGPLLNLSGQVVGINVAMAQGAQNIGFAIPIDQVKKALDEVKNNGKISRPYIGVRYMMIDDQVKAQNNLPYNYGALVIRGSGRGELAVIPGSPADKAGLVENDIILEIDGKKLTADNDLSKVIQKRNVGDELTLKVWSDGQEKTVKLKLAEANQ